MKTLQKHKKVIRNTLLNLICALFFVVSSSYSAKADIIKQGTTATTYGSYHWECFAGTTNSPVSLGLNIIGIDLEFRSGSGLSFRYNFKNKYSGQITIGITTGSSWRYIDAYCTVNGGAFNSTPANSSSYLTYHTFTINFEQCECLEFTVYLDGAAYSNYFDANTTISIAYGITPVVDDKLTEIDDMIDAYLPGMSETLTNLANDIDNIDTNISTLLGYVDGIEGYIDGIESTLSNIYSRVNNLLPTMSTNIGNIYNLLAADFPEYSIDSWLFFRSYLTGPTATFSRYNDILTYYTTSRSNLAISSFDSAKSFRLWKDTPLILCFATSTNADFDTGYNDFSAFTFYTSDGNGLPSITSGKIGAFNVSEWDYHYIVITGSVNVKNVCISFNPTLSGSGPSGTRYNIHPVYFGPYNQMPDDVCRLYGFDFNNTYTRLLQQIANGIGDISVQQINENNTNINNYNNYQTQINQVENNYYNQFNNIETNIENNNTFDFTGLTNEGVSVYNNLFTNMYSIPLVKWPVLITLLGLVIVIILG